MGERFLWNVLTYYTQNVCLGLKTILDPVPNIGPFINWRQGKGPFPSSGKQSGSSSITWGRKIHAFAIVFGMNLKDNSHSRLLSMLIINLGSTTIIGAIDYSSDPNSNSPWSINLWFKWKNKSAIRYYRYKENRNSNSLITPRSQDQVCAAHIKFLYNELKIYSTNKKNIRIKRKKYNKFDVIIDTNQGCSLANINAFGFLLSCVAISCFYKSNIIQCKIWCFMKREC